MIAHAKNAESLRVLAVSCAASTRLSGFELGKYTFSIVFPH
jgi:hypothetical protein